MQRRTFVIAHRLSTIRRADQILLLERGQVLERGTHPELLAMKACYFELYMQPQGVESNLFLAPGEGDTVPQGLPELKPDAPERASPSNILQV